MIKILRKKTKYGERLALVISNGVYRPKIFFDKDIICALLDINYNEYWRLTRSDEDVNIEFKQII